MKLSVVIPCYNERATIETVVEAVRTAPVEDIEIIVVDDASTDNSLEVLSSFARKHPIIRVYSNERNLGVIQTINRGLQLARCEYVFSSAADDEVKPGLFEHSVRLFRAHPEAGICSGICEWREASSGLTWHMGTTMPNRPCYLSPAEMIDLSRRGRLAPLIVEQMAQMILELKAQGVSILLSEQNMHFAELVSDRAYVLEKGQIRYQATMAELAANDEVRRAYLSM
jgi:glycosyltransferase involved in cell wall biosynthesis